MFTIFPIEKQQRIRYAWCVPSTWMIPYRGVLTNKFVVRSLDNFQFCSSRYGQSVKSMLPWNHEDDWGKYNISENGLWKIFCLKLNSWCSWERKHFFYSWTIESRLKPNFDDFILTMLPFSVHYFVVVTTP